MPTEFYEKIRVVFEIFNSKDDRAFEKALERSLADICDDQLSILLTLPDTNTSIQYSLF